MPAFPAGMFFYLLAVVNLLNITHEKKLSQEKSLFLLNINKFEQFII